MFRALTLFSFLSFLSCSALLLVLFLSSSPADRQEYERIVAESAELHSKRPLQDSPARQQRRGVQKDFWAAGITERSHLRLRSDTSELLLIQNRGKIEATESLRHLECWFQEEIDTRSHRQQLRYFTADTGQYDYPAHRFTAHAVHLSFFDLPGLELPLQTPEDKAPFLKGIAEQVLFQMTQKTPTFTAYHLQAELLTEGARQ
jgi:hypothetical protein